MKVNKIYPSIQGEGTYAGYPVLFIRLSGCTRNCDFCDTKYHITGKEMTPKQVADKIVKSGKEIIVWTGGEPMLQIDEIDKVIQLIKRNRKVSFESCDIDNKFHLETNGDILPPLCLFDYICFSPKDKITAQNVLRFIQYSPKPEWDIKVVTNLEMNKELIPYSTMLMPLTEIHQLLINESVRKKVWNYCIKHNKRYSPRLHVELWGQKKGV